MTGRRELMCVLSLGLAGCVIPRGEPIVPSRVAAVAAADAAIALVAPACPDWHRNSREDFSNRTGSNFGCADAVNFLGQLVEPSDAIRGRATGRQEGVAAAGAVERYRTRKTMPLGAGGQNIGASGAPAGGPS